MTTKLKSKYPSKLSKIVKNRQLSLGLISDCKLNKKPIKVTVLASPQDHLVASPNPNQELLANCPSCDSSAYVNACHHPCPVCGFMAACNE